MNKHILTKGCNAMIQNGKVYSPVKAGLFPQRSMIAFIVIQKNGNGLWVITKRPFGLRPLKNEVIFINIAIPLTRNIFWIHAIAKITKQP